VSVKMRLGFTQDDLVAPDCAARFEAAGAAALCVHGRYAEQMYHGSADWEAIARVREHITIPLIGNGDLRDPADPAAMREICGCDSFMIARAAQGNPWVFERMKAALGAGDGTGTEVIPPEPTYAERLDQLKAHARRLNELNPKTFLRIRKQASWYVKGMPGAAFARREFYDAQNIDEIVSVIKKYRDYLSERGELAAR